MLKISTINVNGIRAAERKGFSEWVSLSNPDIICIQELKAKEYQIPEQIENLKYHSWYHSAEKKGYSGVGILSRTQPLEVKIGMGLDWADQEGRVLMAEYETFRLFSIYFPSGTTGSVRQDLKYEFMDYFIPFIKKYLNENKPVILTGDFNIAHKDIDIFNPATHQKSSGFLPDERAWVTKLLNHGFTDAFRVIHPDEKNLYSWWSYRAASKERNKGWRLDYHIISDDLRDVVKDAVIEKDWDMSDHAPVSVTYDLIY